MAFGTSLGGIEANRVGYGPLVPEHVPGRSGTRRRRSRTRSSGSVPSASRAFFIEPVIGAGGVCPPPDGYIQAVAEICRDAGVLFVVRLGHLRLRPARHLARLRALRRPARPGHLRQGRDERLSAAGRRRRLRACGRAVLDRARARLRPPRPDLLRPRGGLRGGAREPRHPRARGAGRRAAASSRASCSTTLAPLADHPLVGEVRGGTGALVGVAFDPDALAADPALPGKAYRAIRPHGVILRALGSVARRLAAADDPVGGDPADPRCRPRRPRRARREPRPGRLSPPAEPLLIRPATAADERDWRRLWAGYCKFYGVVVPEETTAGTWRRILAPADQIGAVLAIQRAETLGFANYVLYPFTWSERPTCYLEDLYVSPEARGRGVGKAERHGPPALRQFRSCRRVTDPVSVAGYNRADSGHGCHSRHALRSHLGGLRSPICSGRAIGIWRSATATRTSGLILATCPSSR